MRQSKLFTKTSKHDPAGEVSLNAKLLERSGFVHKNSAGVYTYLPLGWRVIQKIAQIIREEMNTIGGQEMYMPALVEKKYLDATNRWDVDVGFEVRGKKEEKASFVLGWTHEEVLSAIAARFISSYKDLPFAAYQIQTKFRNEPRAKSGLLRGREFIMKDLYSFHVSEKDLWQYYETVRRAYENVFTRCGLEAVYTEAAGGDFTVSHTHEFQVISSVGEDTILICEKCRRAENLEISQLKDGESCPQCGGKIRPEKAIEVGNIFPLGTKYSESFGLSFINEEGRKTQVVMGSYGIGLGRTMGAIVEIHHDERGIIWPKNVAPASIHLLELSGGKNRECASQAETIYETLRSVGIEVLYDDRMVSAGVKFADCDLIGIPWRAVVSEKTFPKKQIELKKRDEQKTDLADLPRLVKKLKIK